MSLPILGIEAVGVKDLLAARDLVEIVIDDEMLYPAGQFGDEPDRLLPGLAAIQAKFHGGADSLS